MILNLTAHEAIHAQLDAGVSEPSQEAKARIVSLLTFKRIPSLEELSAIADALAQEAATAGASSAIIGGPPFLMSALERALAKKGIEPLHVFVPAEASEKSSAESSAGLVPVARIGSMQIQSPPSVAEFASLAAARSFRAQHGGWIFHARSGQAIWFSSATTPSKIFLHPATRGLSGTLH